MREIELTVELEALLLLGRENAVNQLPDSVRLHHRKSLERCKLAPNTDDRGRARGDVEVRRAATYGGLEKRVD